MIRISDYCFRKLKEWSNKDPQSWLLGVELVCISKCVWSRSLTDRILTDGDIVESCSMIPFDYNEFVGREQCLQELDEKLSLGRGDNRAALVGDRGCGSVLPLFPASKSLLY